MKCIDLHTHTIHSDGTLSPVKLVEQAHANRLCAISITDHDTIDALAQGQAAAERLGIEFVPGCELSVYEGDIQIHILGYYIDATNQALITQLENLRALRDQRNDSMLKALERLGMPIPRDVLRDMASSRLITRMHVAKAMKHLGYCRTYDEAFEKYISYGRPAFVPHESMSVSACIDVLRGAGGVPVLAHPYSYELNTEEIEPLIAKLASYGLEGLECFYHNHTKMQTKRALSWASKHRLLSTGGSDFHGANRPGVELGRGSGGLCVPYSVWENLANHVNKIR